MDGKTAPKWIIVIFLVLSSLLHFIFALRNPVQTSSGPVVGTAFTYNCKHAQAFLGIPYAEAPVGDMRFKKPVPKNPWLTPLQATNFPPACIQHYVNYSWVDGLPNQSEDCLYLNVWVPPNTTKFSKKAVMFWIFGGSFRYGSNRLPVYDSQVLAIEEDVIVVTINYRLCILGFLSGGSDEAMGNMGFHDMLEALKWVKCNIGAFGGDSDTITIFGQSAGAISVGVLCVSPLAEDLFKRAILQTGSSAYPVIHNPKENAVLAQKVAEAVGCASDNDSYSTNPGDVIRCFRTKNARQLIEISFKLGQFFPIIGDDVLPSDPKVQLVEGNFNDVDVLVGHTQDEGSLNLVEADPATFGMYGQNNPQLNKTVGTMYITAVFKDFPGKELVVQHYLGGLKEDDYDAVREQTYHSIGDFFFSCPDAYFAESYAKKGRNAYAYYFNHIPSVTPWAPWMGSVHFDDVAFVFGRPLDHRHDYTLAERCLSRRLMRIWATFAKTGNPGERWPKFSRTNPYFKIFNISNRTSYLEQDKQNCEFFRQFTLFV